MKKAAPYLSVALAIAAGAVAGIGHYMIAGFTGFVATALGTPMLMHSVPRAGRLIPLLGAVAAGVAVEFITDFNTFGLLALAIVLSALAVQLRLLFYPTLGRTQYRALEFIIVGLAIASIAAGNLVLAPEQANWQTWAIPGVFALYGLMMSMGSFMDNAKNLSSLRKGFNVKVGQKAPDFELPNEEGVDIKLSDFRGKRHVLLVFYRGDWCPYCNMMLRTYAKAAPKFQRKDIMLLGIGPDDPQANRQLVEALNLDFHILADEGMEIVQRYGIQVKNHNPSGRTKYNDDSPLPASFLIDKEGVLRYTSHPERVGEYLDPSTIFPVVDALEEDRLNPKAA